MKLAACLVVLVLVLGVCEGRKCTERELKSHRTWCDTDGNAPPPRDVNPELKAFLEADQKEDKATKPAAKDGKGLQAFEDPKSVDETPEELKTSKQKDKKSPSFLEMRNRLNSKARSRAPIKFAGAGVPANCITQGDLDATLAAIAIGAPPSTPRASAGVVIASAPYDGSKYHHMFTQFAPLGPTGDINDGRCYDPAIIVLLPGEPIDVDYMEFKKGCTPFRNVSRILQNYLECIDPILSQVTGGRNWEQSKELYIERIARVAMKSTAANFHQAVINWLNTHGWQQQTDRDKADFAHCTTVDGTHNALMCYPALTHASGSLREGDSGGVQSHDSNWLKDAETVKDCRIHPACARLAATEILGFSLRPYSKFTFWDNTTPDWARCRAETGNQNCRLWARCWMKATRGVCAAHAACCPSQAVHTACSAPNGLSAAGCKNRICTNP